MADDIDNIVIEHLRAIRGQLGRMDNQLTDVGQRMTGLERAVASLGTSLAHHGDAGALQAHRIDGLAARLDRIERRLDFKEG